MTPFLLIWLGWLLICATAAAANALLGAGLLGVGFLVWGAIEALIASREREQAKADRERESRAQFLREARERPACRHDGPC